ncbi:hypothetical protein ACLOAV_002656 [Pseudogymnoascus australis]
MAGDQLLLILMPRRSAQRQSLAPVRRDDEEERTMKRRRAASTTTNTASDEFLGRQQQTRRASVTASCIPSTPLRNKCIPHHSVSESYLECRLPESMHTRTPTPRVHLHGAKRPSSRRDRGGEETAARLARRRVALSRLIGVIAIAARVKITMYPYWCATVEWSSGY